MLNKKKLNFARMSVFLTKKLSANSANNAYTLGLDGTVELGEPDIMWQTVCFIKDAQKIWTGGQIYNCSEVDVENFATKEDLEELQPAGEYLTSFTETDPVWNAEKDNYALKRELPTKLSDLENDAEFITSSSLEELATLEYVESIEQVTAAALTDLLKYSIKPLANEPTDNLFVGRTYFDTTDNKQYFYTGTKWVDAMGNNKV